MTKKPDLAELLRANPKAHSDAALIEKARDVVRVARESGVRSHTYDLLSPFAKPNDLPRRAASNLK
jgi:hypothetical protein